MSTSLKPAKPSCGFTVGRRRRCRLGDTLKKKNEIDFAYCSAQHIVPVNRITGGKTVFHDRELTYSFICPAALMPAGILDTYRFIGTCLMKGLAFLGIRCEMNDHKKTDRSSVCFREISGYEITSGGKKLIGSAQHRNAAAILQHGSILMDVRPEVWLRIWSNRITVPDIMNRIVSLKHILSPRVSEREISQCIVDGFVSHAGFTAEERDFNTAERMHIESLTPKYTTNDFPGTANAG